MSPSGACCRVQRKINEERGLLEHRHPLPGGHHEQEHLTGILKEGRQGNVEEVLNQALYKENIQVMKG